MNWTDALPNNRRRGSYLRCLTLMHGDRIAVADRLTQIIKRDGVQITANDFWMPQGKPVSIGIDVWDKEPIKEAELGRSPSFLTEEQKKKMNSWWLDIERNATTPNWDIASTATINGKRGLVLIEAKAHDTELQAESLGKKLAATASDNSRLNHEKIGCAIEEARDALNGNRSGWAISRDCHYQLSNRVAWAWKLSSMNIPNVLNIPVVLVYLGFLNADEMTDRGIPFKTNADWETCVKDHSKNIVPEGAWEIWQITNKSAGFLPIIRSYQERLEVNA
jgi:hypothetical protein